MIFSIVLCLATGINGMEDKLVMGSLLPFLQFDAEYKEELNKGLQEFALHCQSKVDVNDIAKLVACNTNISIVLCSDAQEKKFAMEEKLHELARTGQGEDAIKALKELLAQGVNINSKDENGRTPRDNARLNRDSSMTQVIKELGGKPSDSIVRGPY